MSILFNPPGRLLAENNAVVSGRSRAHDVLSFEGTLSIKTVRYGLATWEADRKRSRVDSGVFLVLNHGQRYNLEIRTRDLTETFCVFFRPGYVEGIKRAMLSDGTDALGDLALAPFGFYEQLHAQDGKMARAMDSLRWTIELGTLDDWEGEEAFISVAKALTGTQLNLAERRERLPAVKASTREELARQLSRAREFMLACYDQPLDLATVAQEASMSPHHFHEMFSRSYGETQLRFLTRRRVIRARHLLKETRLSVQEVLAQVGFQSASSFSKLYRKQFGCLPSEDSKNSED